ncbi:MAG: hypothetical protein JXB45_11765 [Candidatus Krumholzibacteriota bacterium]|nr:hypothetical protein [Candidatus Krumholzibacteriota bacterium]
MFKIRINLLILATSIIVGLVLAETAFRLFIEQERKRLAVYDKDLGWRGKPHGKGVYIRKSDNIRVEYKYNRYGYRDEDFSPAPSVYTRIVLVGDSFVEGLEVAYRKTFHRRLEDHLYREYPDQFEVISLASQGYSTAQELAALKKLWTVVKPDIAILCFYTGNDFSENLRSRFIALDGEGKIQFRVNTDSWVKVRYCGLKRWAYENIHLIFFLKNLMNSSLRMNIADTGKRTMSTSPERRNNVTRQLLFAAAEEAGRRGARWAVVIIPSKYELMKADSSLAAYVAETCEIQNVPYLNLFSIMSRDCYYGRDAHLNDRGHQVLEEEIYEFIDTEMKGRSHDER